MDSSNFTADAPGRLVANLDGLPAFLPNELPPTIDVDPKLFKLAAEVSGHLGRLDGTARALPDPSLLIRSFIRREAQLSSYIENTYADYAEVGTAGETEDPAKVPYPVRETLNAERAILAGIDAVRAHSVPITLSMIRQLHGVLLDNVRGHETRGRFRTVQVYIGDPSLGREHARFVPPPPQFVPELMEHHQTYLNSQDDFPLPIRLALLHYHFETIHPFDNGNGRLGRTLILLGLCTGGLLTVPILNPSLYLERNRSDYYNGLLDVSTSGKWNHWIEFFLDALGAAAVESDAKMREILQLQASYQSRLRELRSSAATLHIVDRLLVDPVVTTKQVARWTGLTTTGARKNLRRLADAGILTEVPNTKPVRFRAEKIIQVLNPIPTRR